MELRVLSRFVFDSASAIPHCRGLRRGRARGETERERESERGERETYTHIQADRETESNIKKVPVESNEHSDTKKTEMSEETK